MRYRDSANKATMKDEFLKTPFCVGDKVTINGEYGRQQSYEVVSVDPLKVRSFERDASIIKVKKEAIVSRSSRHIGANPFAPEERIRAFAFPIESILSQVRLAYGCEPVDVLNGITILEYNNDPIVYVNKKAKHYQREFCWTLDDKQQMIESIYNNVDCGLIIVRLRSIAEITKLYRNGDVPSFRDIVDGKQRLEALRGFIYDEYPDLHGNLFSDLSDEAQYRLMQSKALTYAEIAEDSSDDLILRQFLKMNFCGKPQSPEHLKYVAELYASKEILG